MYPELARIAAMRARARAAHLGHRAGAAPPDAPPARRPRPPAGGRCGWRGGTGAGRGDGLAGGGKRDLDGLVDGRDIHRGVDGFAVDRLDIGDFPRLMLAVDPDVEAYGAVAQHLQLRGHGLTEAGWQRLQRLGGT